MADNPQLPLPSTATRQPRPFTAFTRRALAFIIDVVLIYFVGYTLQMGAREPLLRLGPLLPFLSSCGAFAYFWLGNGPVGHGATLGKAILNLHVVGVDGSPLDLKTSFRRTLFQLPPIAWAIFRLFRDVFDLNGLIPYFIGDFLSMISLTIIFTHSYSAVTHPRRRGWHDLWVGSYVSADPTPKDFFLLVNEPPDDLMRVRLKTYKFISVIFFLLVGLVMGGQLTWSYLNPAFLASMEFTGAIRPHAALEGYRLEEVGFVSAESGQDQAAGKSKQDQSKDSRKAPKTRMQTAPEDSRTTASMQKAAEIAKKDKIVFRYAKIWGGASRAEMDDPKLRDELEKLRSDWHELYSQLGMEQRLSKPPANYFIARFDDPFRFVVFPWFFWVKHFWVAHGETDPASGPLHYEWVELEQKEDQQRKPQSGTAPANALPTPGNITIPTPLK